VTAPLRQGAPCTFVGAVTVDDRGRWFVYAEVDVHGELTEAWIPVEQGRPDKRTELYLAADEGPRLGQVIVGVLLYWPARPRRRRGASKAACRRRGSRATRGATASLRRHPAAHVEQRLARRRAVGPDDRRVHLSPAGTREVREAASPMGDGVWQAALTPPDGGDRHRLARR
jgi:hypothetical protein